MVVSRSYVETRGNGPDVVMLHGVPEDPGDLARLAASMAGFRTHVVHAPGYGRSADVPADGLAIRPIAEALRGRGVATAHWVGMSGGFYRALALVKDAGFGASSFVGIGPAIDFSPEKRAAMEGFAAALEQGADVGDAALQTLYSPSFLRDRPDVGARFLDLLAGVSTTVLPGELRAFAAAPNLGDWLCASGVPTVLRVGAGDQAGLHDGFERLAATPHVSLEWVPRAGHMLLDEDFDDTAESVRRALA
ncbi:MAG: alpha/beta hydrolase [Deltaproteobacteria bacterium]|nr:MAG: alpha/beta hydrolase [Deltaproteobacteria bacterium]